MSGPNSLPDATGYSGEDEQPGVWIYSNRFMVDREWASNAQQWAFLEAMGQLTSDDFDALVAALNAGKTFKC